MAPLAAAAPYLMAASAAMTAVSAIQQGNAANSAAKYNASVANNNAVAARQKAASDAARQEREGRLRAGANRAASGASGVGGVGGAGSPLDILEANAAQEELDRLTIIHGGEVQAIGFENTARSELAAGKAAKKAGMFKAGSSLLMAGASYGAMAAPSPAGYAGAGGMVPYTSSYNANMANVKLV